MKNATHSLGRHPDFPECEVLLNDRGDFCYAHPYPTDDMLRDYYQSGYREVRQEGPTAEYVRFMDQRARAQMDYIIQSTRTPEFASALDIGCGAGRLVNILAGSSKRVWGYEADTAMAAFARTNRASEQIEITNELFQPEHFGHRVDLITMSHVLEHVPNPEKFLTALRENVLTPGGHLFIEVPNDPAYWVEKQIDWKLRGLAHLNFFTKNSIRDFLSRSGYQVVTSRSCGQNLTKFINDKKPKSFMARQLNKLVLFLPEKRETPGIYDTSISSIENIYLQVTATTQ